MSLFKTVSSKPWTNDQAVYDNMYQGGEASGIPSATLGFRLFLVVVTVLFLLLYVAYSGRIVFPDWQGLPRFSLLWFNSLLLIGCSLLLWQAQLAASKGDTNFLKTYIFLAGVFSVAFLGSQLFVWERLIELGYYANVNPINGFFYLLTGVHGLHLLGGLIVWLHCAIKTLDGTPAKALTQTTRLLAHYWHFLLAIWFIIFLTVPQFLTLLPEERWKAWCSLL